MEKIRNTSKQKKMFLFLIRFTSKIYKKDYTLFKTIRRYYDFGKIQSCNDITCSKNKRKR